MNKLIIPDTQPDLLNLEPYNKRVEEICLQLEAEHPDWLRLDEDLLVHVLSQEEIGQYRNRTFIIADRLTSSRRHISKISRLVLYMFSIGRKLDWSFVIIGPSLKAIDLRIRYSIDEVEEWNGRT